MPDRKKATPRLETMESLMLLSGAATSMRMPPVHAEVATTTTTNPLAVGDALKGTARGPFHSRLLTACEIDGTTSPPGTITVGGVRAYDVAASGRLTPIGTARITGELRVNTGVSSGPPSGTLLLTTKQGTLALRIPDSVAEPEGLPRPTSTHEVVDTYTITGGTGAYEGLTGTGVVGLTFTAGGSARGVQAGHVAIKFTGLDPVATTT